MIPDTNLKVLFFGSSDYCLPVVETLYQHFQLIGVVTQPNLSSPIKQFALSHNIQCLIPKGKEELLLLKKKLEEVKPDLAIVADYGIIIPNEIFTFPRFKTLNIHFSNLPKYRGPSPVQYTILYGEKNACISVIIMDEGLDTGNIVYSKEVLLYDNETTESLYKKLFNNISLELPEVISQYAQNKLIPRRQDHKKATYTKLLTREDGFISSRLLDLAMQGKKASSIERALRAFTPWPGLWTIIQVHPNQPRRLKILAAHIEGNKLTLDQVQLEGKNPVTWKQFREGYPNCSFI